jgi:uncharacterized tellurite resistance protein B-like protein
MLRLLKKYLLEPFEGKSAQEKFPRERALTAAAALLLAVAESDRHFAPEEDRLIRHILLRDLGVPEGDMNALLDEARKTYEEKVDFFELTTLVNHQFNREEKMKVLDLLWQVVFADGVLEAHEDQLMHRLAELLNLSHRELMNAKLQARKHCFRMPS